MELERELEARGVTAPDQREILSAMWANEVGEVSEIDVDDEKVNVITDKEFDKAGWVNPPKNLSKSSKN